MVEVKLFWPRVDSGRSGQGRCRLGALANERWEWCVWCVAQEQEKA